MHNLREEPMKNFMRFGLMCATVVLLGATCNLGGTTQNVNNTNQVNDNQPTASEEAAAKEQTSVLLVAEAKSGTFTKADNGTYTLSMSGVEPDMVWFTDRPARHAGRVEVQKALDALYEDASGPPNAALSSAHPETGEEQIVIVELTDPQYDAASATLSFNALSLEEPKQGLEKYADKDVAANLISETLNEPVLFIDNLFRYSQCRIVINNNSANNLYWWGDSDPTKGGKAYGNQIKGFDAIIFANESLTSQWESPTWGDDCRVSTAWGTVQDDGSAPGFVVNVLSPATGSNSASIRQNGSGCNATVSLNDTSGVLAIGTVNFTCP